MTKIRADIDGLDEFLRAMNRAPKETKDELRTASTEIAELVAAHARRKAMSGSPQLAAIAPTIKAKRDRIPSIQAGSAKRVTSSGAKAHEIFFGANFGSNTYRQFPARNRTGRTIYPAIREHQDEAADLYLDAVRKVFMR